MATAGHNNEVETHGEQIKKRAACDECRTKKLKCTGEHPACSRCCRENITCVYSPQKQMGRPKKRQRNLDDELEMSQLHPTNSGESMSWNADYGTGGHEQLQGNQFDLGGVEAIYTTEGELQPWLLEQTQAWAEDISRDHTGNEMAGMVPALTPDSSSHSPPLHMPSHETPAGYNGSAGRGTDDDRHGSTGLLLDPNFDGSNIGLSSSTLPKCACLSTMYLVLSSLQSMDESFKFPFALHPLREAIKTTSDIVDCPECPKRFITGVQNAQIIGTVVVSIAERFVRILQSISSEATRAELAGETKKFRLADLNTSTSHLHAGGLGCIAAFNLNLSPAEWRDMCKKVVRAELYGPSDGNDCCVHFIGLLKQIEARQDDWHRRPPPPDAPKDISGQLVGTPRHLMKKEDHLCMKLIHYATHIVEKLDWT